MSKQTAVEWLESRIKVLIPDDIGSQLMFKSNLEKAKTMEREQIIEAWDGGNYGYFYSKGSGKDFNDGSEYYKEVYKENNK